MKSIYKISLVTAIALMLISLNLNINIYGQKVDRTNLSSATNPEPIKYFDLRYWICWQFGNYSQCYGM